MPTRSRSAARLLAPVEPSGTSSSTSPSSPGSATSIAPRSCGDCASTPGSPAVTSTRGTSTGSGTRPSPSCRSGSGRAGSSPTTPSCARPDSSSCGASGCLAGPRSTPCTAGPGAPATSARHRCAPPLWASSASSGARPANRRPMTLAREPARTTAERTETGRWRRRRRASAACRARRVANDVHHPLRMLRAALSPQVSDVASAAVSVDVRPSPPPV